MRTNESESAVFMQTFAELSNKAKQIPGPTTPIYLFEIGVAELSGEGAAPFTRIGGNCPGKPLPDEFKHAMSIDLRECPELGARFPGTTVLSLIVPKDAYGDDYNSSGLRMLTLAEAQAAPGLGGKYRPLKLHRLEVPAAMFLGYALDMDEDELEAEGDPLDGQHGPLNELYDELYIHHGALGAFNRQTDNPSEGPDQMFLFTVSDAWIGGSDGRLLVFGSADGGAVFWHR